DQGLAKVEGVEHHRVELNNRRAVLGVTKPEVIGHAVQAIRDLGYEVPTVKQTFPVLGMNCASCAVSAQNIILMQTGVVHAEVNYATGNLVVEYIPQLINHEQLQQALQGVGYDLLIED